VVGLSGLLNQPHDQDQLEKSAAIQPELRAVDAYNGRDPLVAYVRSFGVTTLHTGHAPGAAVSGQTLIVKTHPASVEQAALVPEAMITATIGPSALGADKSSAPGTVPKLMALLRSELLKARDHQRKREGAEPDKKPDRDLRLETLGAVLRRERPLLVTAHRHQDILAALRLAREFEFRLVLDGAADAPLVLDEIRSAGVPVIVHPTMARADSERENLSMETAATLQSAGVRIALQSGYESYVPKTRVVLLEAAVAVAHGLPFEAALAALTLDAARLLGIEARVGSLEPGKDADLALYDGDPFEYTTHCVGVVVSGTVTDTQPR
jgi:imidazolonepropionase-like amidohydrolase